MPDTMTAPLETTSPSPGTSGSSSGSGGSSSSTGVGLADANRSFEALFDSALESNDSGSTDETNQAGQPRDDHGRFAPKTVEEALATQTTPTLQNRSQAPPQTPTDPNAPTAPPSTDAAPFRYRAMAQTHEFRGATMDKDGRVIIAPESVSQFRAALNAWHVTQAETFPTLQKTQQRVVELERQLKDAGESGTLNDTKAKQLVDVLSQTMAIADPQERVNRLFQLSEAWPHLTAKAEAAYWQSQAQRPKPAETPAPTRDPAQDSPYRDVPSKEHALATTWDKLESVKLEHREMQDADWQQFVDGMKRRPYAYLRPATAEEAQQYGVRAGQIVFDETAFGQDVTAHVTQVAAQRDTAKRDRERAVDTARRTTPTIDAPPTASGTTAPPKGPRRIQSKEDWEAWAGSDEID